jgi:hemerythrin-like domain-containing protein
MPAAKKSSGKPASTKKSSPRKTSAGPLDAIKLLKDDHDEVKALFEQYKRLVESEADGDERQTLAETICDMLTVHATIEEEIFYPAARESLAKDDQDLLDEAEVEHASAKELIAQIKDMEPDDRLYDAKVTVLGEYIDHHVQEEETEMFPKCKKSSMELKELGEELMARKEELTSEMAEGTESV